MRVRIAISTSTFDISGSSALRHLKEVVGAEIVLNPHRRRMTEGEIIELLGAHTVGLIAGVEPLTQAVFEAAPALRVVSRCGVGLDNVDQQAAQDHGVDVYTTPDAPTDAVAELTIALMLAVLRGVCLADRALRDDRWLPQQGRLLGRQTVGVLGLGRIGRRVAELCRAFGSQVVVCDPWVEPLAGFEQMDLDGLLHCADVLSLHLPLSPETLHLIGAPALAKMKTGAILINTSRGAIVDETALAEALTTGQLNGAGLDVYTQEPYEGPLSSLDNVVLSPHLGSSTIETRPRMEREAGSNLLEGLRKRGLVD